MNSDIVSWGSIVACVVATVHCAKKYATREAKNSRLFTSLLFFALAWAILLPYYALQDKKETTSLSEVIEFLPVYSGLLLTLAGGPLRREAASRRSKHVDQHIGKYDVWVLNALYLLALPHVLIIPSHGVNIDLTYHGEISMVLGTAFTLLGFYSVVQGLRELTYRKLWWVLAATALSYTIIEIWYTCLLLPNLGLSMPPAFKWLFSAHKLLFSGVFLYLIVQETRASRKTH